MEETTFSFPFMRADYSKYDNLTVAYDDSCNELIQEINDIMVRKFQSSTKGVYVVVGKKQYLKILAFYSEKYGKPSVGETIDDMKIVVLDQDNYLDVVPSPQAMLKQIVREENEDDSTDNDVG